MSSNSKSKTKKHSVPWLLGEAKDPKNIPKLIEFTKSENANERRLAASALGKFSNFKPQISKAVPHLVKLLEDKKPEVRQYSAKSLGKIGSKDAIPHLKKLLNDEMPYVGKAATAAIKRIKRGYEEKSTNKKVEIRKESAGLKNITMNEEKTPWSKLKELVAERDDYHCVVCGKMTRKGQIHHLIHKKDGGTNDLSNLIYLCGRCHMLESEVPPHVLTRVWGIPEEKIKDYKEEVINRLVEIKGPLKERNSPVSEFESYDLELYEKLRKLRENIWTGDNFHPSMFPDCALKLIFPCPIHQSLYDSFKYLPFLMEKRGNRLI